MDKCHRPSCLAGMATTLAWWFQNAGGKAGHRYQRYALMNALSARSEGSNSTFRPAILDSKRGSKRRLDHAEKLFQSLEVFQLVVVPFSDNPAVRIVSGAASYSCLGQGDTTLG